MSKLRVLDLFSGIGGFSLGLERAGFCTVAFCEIDPFCRRVLAKHWPEVPIYDDVRELTGERLAADGIAVDLIAGGFPCQDISFAGNGAGIEGERSRLWFDFARLVGELRPRYAIVENTAALLGRGMGVVLGDLAALRYDAEWHCIPALAVGADHIRDRTWIVAYRDDVAWRRMEGQEWPEPHASAVAYDDRGRREVEREPQHRGEQSELGDLADGLPARRRRNGAAHAADVASARLPVWEWLRPYGAQTLASAAAFDQGRTEPPLVRKLHGIPNRVDRVKALGNSAPPQIPELLGRAILAMEARA